jgi:type VI secretion system secreted protein VgrG
MCIANPPAAPPSGKGANDPTKRTKTQCKKCWREDYEKEISVNPYGRYNESYWPLGISHGYFRTVQYKIFVHLKALNTVVVKVRFKMNPLAGVSDADAKAAKIKLTTGVNTYWNKNNYILEVDDPLCGKKTLNIRYKVAWVTSGQHYTVDLISIPLRANVSGNVMNATTKSTKKWPMTEWTYAHEFAHCVGLPDEYSYKKFITGTVKYYKPDGTLDAAIIAPPNGKDTNAPDATIMSSSHNTTTLKRHAWNIAIEVQELLRSKLGRAINCTIK